MAWPTDPARQSRHPNAPWRWREEWDKPSIEGLPKGIGGLLAGARYGGVRIALTGGVAPIGRECVGRIKIDAGVEFLDLARPVRCVLTCIHHRESGSGRNRRVSLTEYWRDEREIALEQSGRGAVAVYRCGIPADRPATTMESYANRIYWELRITQEVPGADLDHAFELPVFLVDDATLAATVGTEVAAELAVTPELAPTAPDAGDGMRFERRGDGFRLDVAPGRHLSMAWIATLLGVVFTAAGIHLATTDSPFFGALFLLIAVAMWYGAGRLWFREVTVTADSQQLVVITTVLRLFWERIIPAAEVGHVYLEVGVTFGNTPYWDVKAVPREGNEFTVVPSVPDESKAKFLMLALAATLRVPVAATVRPKMPEG